MVLEVGTLVRIDMGEPTCPEPEKCQCCAPGSTGVIVELEPEMYWGEMSGACYSVLWENGSISSAYHNELQSIGCNIS